MELNNADYKKDDKMDKVIDKTMTGCSCIVVPFMIFALIAGIVLGIMDLFDSDTENEKKTYYSPIYTETTIIKDKNGNVLDVEEKEYDIRDDIELMPNDGFPNF